VLVDSLPFSFAIVLAALLSSGRQNAIPLDVVVVLHVAVEVEHLVVTKADFDTIKTNTYVEYEKSTFIYTKIHYHELSS
jgi:hypothetical protein